MSIKTKAIAPLLAATLAATIPAAACTNFLVTKGASTDGSTMVTYAADSHSLYGEVYHWPAATYRPGTMLQIVEWDTQIVLGEIPQVERTYNVVGNMNEHQLIIGETTYGGREELVDTAGLMDYGSLIYIALQRSRNAREAMKVITDLVAAHGYHSSGESFSLADPNEVWIMEMIGKGPGGKGAVWVARMVPDGYVSGHANQARITTFEYQAQNNWFDANQTTFNSADVISFAREKGYYNGTDADFSFSDIYAPVDFGAARFSEIRVWAFFKDVNKDMWQHFDYVKGNVQHNEHGIATNRMPLWIKPERKLSPQDMMEFMRDHLEGTELDMRKDIGAGPFECPYRWRPMTWQADSVDYVFERATATQQTGFSFVGQSRSWLPEGMGGILWFGVDDAGTSVYAPLYTSITKIPEPFRQGNGSMTEFSETSAFWLFNMVTNMAYGRYNVIAPEIRKVMKEADAKFAAETAEMDKRAIEAFAKNPRRGVAMLTEFSDRSSQWLFNRWKELFQFLVVKFIDGNVKPDNNGVFTTTPAGVINVEFPGYPEWWRQAIVAQTADKLLNLGSDRRPDAPETVTISKTNLNILIGLVIGLVVILLAVVARRKK